MGTLGSVALLNRDEFNAIETDAAYSGEHAAAAQQMDQLASTGTPAPEISRAEAYLRASDQWLQADDPAAAADSCRRAIADGGPVSVDPRAPLARAQFLLGQQDEGRGLIAELKAEGPADPRTCDLVAELLVDYDDLPGALEWATAGVELCLQSVPEPDRDPAPARQLAAVPSPRRGSDDENELRLLLSLRYRIRNDLGLPEDRYDAMLDEA